MVLGFLGSTDYYSPSFLALGVGNHSEEKPFGRMLVKKHWKRCDPKALKGGFGSLINFGHSFGPWAKVGLPKKSFWVIGTYFSGESGVNPRFFWPKG